MKLSATVALVLLSLGPSFARLMVRASPTLFPELPANVVRELQRRGCTILQDANMEKPNNVIKGEFAASGQTDWAVLCSVKGVSTILVFWNGSEKNPAAIAPMEDRNYLQTKRTGACSGYSRRITPLRRLLTIKASTMRLLSTVPLRGISTMGSG
jgi:hypothetical protein